MIDVPDTEITGLIILDFFLLLYLYHNICY